ncbi:Disease resistance protein (CC-NBS-LRR) [Rhynchospora pubera]|uniref:Disease resistance protein (CC-NBS-LRR) n=1 Tax=Rhynchospora pubera TaxID=906938 RepID=A0AAV8ELJ3_9POAL|nr:Disease resistance protein (CC-NBS-LRR) [Rhynchospora pubera]
MAMVIDAFLGNLSSLAAQMVQDEVGMLLGIPGEIENLGKTVSTIQCVLSDAERRQTKGSAIEQWLLDLKDVMYDADDLLDLCQIKAEDRRTHSDHPDPFCSKFSCCVNFLYWFRNPVFAHGVGTQIKELNSRLEEIAKKKSDLGLIELQGQSNVHDGHVDISHKTDPTFVVDDVVGEKIEKDAELLVRWLTKEEMGVKVFGVVGMPGIGKSTLAKKVFNDPKIVDEFHKKFWVCVSKNLEGVEVLKCIIRAAGGNHGVAEQRSELVPMLQQLVQGKKFLLVLDDVWRESQNVWDNLLRDAMIGGAHGSRVLVTTRHGDVARFMGAAASHHVEKLSDEDAWSLLIKQVSINQIESEILEDIGLQLVKRCDGLPLAVKAIGGVLRTRDKNEVEWQKVLKSDLWSAVDLPSGFHRTFYLSYADLPSDLKQCFIFCSLYPKDFEYEKSDLIYLWFTEGLLCDTGDSSFWELGKRCYNQLISRNLLEVSSRHYGDYYCTMPDMWRSFAEFLGKGENFIMRKAEFSHSSKYSLKLRRLSVETTIVDPDFLKIENPLRTLVIRNNPMGDVLSDMLLSFPYLRMLDLYKSNINSLPDSFCDLVHLRYLNLEGSKLQNLPNSIGNLRKLVYLNLKNCEQLSHVPSSICDLLDLRFLSLYRSKVEVFPMGLRKLKKLVEFHGFTPYDNSNGFSSLEDLGTLDQILELSLCGLEKAMDVTLAKKANLKDKVHLKHLQLRYSLTALPTIEERKAAEDVLNELRPPPTLEFLMIDTFCGFQLPWLHVRTYLSELKNLKFLELHKCVCFSRLPCLGQLPNLDFLIVRLSGSIKRIGREIFLDDSEDHTEFSQSSILPFPQLIRLEFSSMTGWVEWLWEEDQPAMPKLEKLIIDECRKLPSLPTGLSYHATSLKRLEINKCEALNYVEGLQSLQDLVIIEGTNLKRISNLPKLSYLGIRDCPNLEILENLKPFYRMALHDIQMETLPEYLITAMAKNLTIWCKNELSLKITSQRVGGTETEWKKFEHIPVVNIYSRDDSIIKENISIHHKCADP